MDTMKGMLLNSNLCPKGFRGCLKHPVPDADELWPHSEMQPMLQRNIIHHDSL